MDSHKFAHLRRTSRMWKRWASGTRATCSCAGSTNSALTYSRAPLERHRVAELHIGLQGREAGRHRCPAGFNPDVDSYTVYNASVTYTGVKNLTLTFGIKNLLDTDPPFTAHNLDFAAGAGWDPRVADPRGRAFTLRVSYKFF